MTKAATDDKARPFSIRLTEGEKQRLQAKAGSVPLGIFIREAALADEVPARRVARKTPVKDGEALCRLLGLLGQSRLANNLNQLAKATNMGSLPVTEETQSDLRDACAAVFEMRLLLLKALGLRILEEAVEYRTPLPEIFEVAAGSSDR